ncbi:MAG: hypothetical protein KW802_02035 [Candidatus Doudnabacteria bacterium]|nr:hypothetical protein [Candidatus Doudnabacteria bacterium]
MRKMLTVLAVLVCAGCGDKNNLPTAPSGAAITASSPKIVVDVARALHSEAGRCFASITIRGTGGVNDLLNGLPLQSAPNIGSGEHWAGSWIRAVDWGYNPLGAGTQTAVPFVPGEKDQYQMDDVPFDCTKGPDWTFQWIPGGSYTLDASGHPSLKSDARQIPVLFNQSNVTVRTLVSVKVTFTEPDAKGLVHMKMDQAPF